METQLISRRNLKADRFLGIDILNNIYFLKGNLLYKKTENQTFSYGNINYGKPFSVDFQNPFKIILFFKDYNSVIILDNKLNELTPVITFSGKNITLVQYASENNLWIYSKDDNILQLFDYQNHNYKLNTQPLSFYQSGFMADKMFSTYKNIWLYNQNGILQFNQYVSFLKKIPVKNCSKIFPFRKGILCLRNKQLFYYDKDNKRITVDLKIPGKQNDLFILKDLIFLFKEDTLNMYRIK